MQPPTAGLPQQLTLHEDTTTTLLAKNLCLFSAQMITAASHIYPPTNQMLMTTQQLSSFVGVVSAWEAAEGNRGGSGGPNPGPLCTQRARPAALAPAAGSGILLLLLHAPTALPFPSLSPNPPHLGLSHPYSHPHTGICLSRQDPNTFAICFETGASLSLCQAPRSRLEDQKPYRLMQLPLYPVSPRESWQQTM